MQMRFLLDKPKLIYTALNSANCHTENSYFQNKYEKPEYANEFYATSNKFAE